MKLRYKIITKATPQARNPCSGWVLNRDLSLRDSRERVSHPVVEYRPGLATGVVIACTTAEIVQIGRGGQTRQASSKNE